MLNKLKTLEMINVTKVDAKNNSKTINFTKNGELTYYSEDFYVKTNLIRPIDGMAEGFSVNRDGFEKYLKIFDENTIDVEPLNGNVHLKEKDMDVWLESVGEIGYSGEIGETTYEFELNLAQLQKELKYMEKFQSKDTDRRALMGSQLRYDGTIVEFSGLDGYRAYQFQQRVETPEQLEESVKSVLSADFLKAILKLKGKTPNIVVKLTEKATIIQYDGLELGGYDVDVQWFNNLDGIMDNASVSDDTACDLSSTEIKELLGFLKKIKGVENGEILVVTDVFDDYIEVKVRTKTSKDYLVKKNFKFKEYKGSNMTGEHETKAYNLKYLTEALESFAETGLTLKRNDSVNPIFFSADHKRAIVLPVRLA